MLLPPDGGPKTRADMRPGWGVTLYGQNSRQDAGNRQGCAAQAEGEEKRAKEALNPPRTMINDDYESSGVYFKNS